MSDPIARAMFRKMYPTLHLTAEMRTVEKDGMEPSCSFMGQQPCFPRVAREVDNHPLCGWRTIDVTRNNKCYTKPPSPLKPSAIWMVMIPSSLFSPLPFFFSFFHIFGLLTASQHCTADAEVANHPLCGACDSRSAGSGLLKAQGEAYCRLP